MAAGAARKTAEIHHSGKDVALIFLSKSFMLQALFCFGGEVTAVLGGEVTECAPEREAHEGIRFTNLSPDFTCGVLQTLPFKARWAHDGLPFISCVPICRPIYNAFTALHKDKQQNTNDDTIQCSEFQKKWEHIGLRPNGYGHK